MDREELIRLAGEQALLSKEAKELSAEHNRDKQSLLTLYNSINMGVHPSAHWLPEGIALLTRLSETQQKLNDLRARLASLSKLTGM